jgi:hypothetical protein
MLAEVDKIFDGKVMNQKTRNALSLTWSAQ